jgi:hypothetical protein
VNVPPQITLALVVLIDPLLRQCRGWEKVALLKAMLAVFVQAPRKIKVELITERFCSLT